MKKLYHINRIRLHGKFFKEGDIIPPNDDRKFSNIFKAYCEGKFEDYRYRIYPGYPSRISALFAIEEKDIDYWVDKLNAESGDFQILEIEISESDSQFVFDEKYYNDFDDAEDKDETVKKYWESLFYVDKEKPVYLINKDVRVSKIIKEKKENLELAESYSYMFAYEDYMCNEELVFEDHDSNYITINDLDIEE